MQKDREFKALEQASEAIKDLEPDAQQRILQYLFSKYGSKIKTSAVLPKDNWGFPPRDLQSVNLEIGSFGNLAELFSKTNIDSDADKVLFAAAYLQEKNSGLELTGREINKELTHLGHGVSNITNAISSLINRKPSLMIQTRKEGKTQQAQKKYKVTHEGIKRMKEMIAQENE